jgi:hypothetical protein
MKAIQDTRLCTKLEIMLHDCLEFQYYNIMIFQYNKQHVPHLILRKHLEAFKQNKIRKSSLNRYQKSLKISKG